MHIFCEYHICNKSTTTWHHVQIYKKATSLQHIGNQWLRGICSPAMGAKIYAKLFICLYAKMAKICEFRNRNTFAYMLASCANLNFHPVLNFVYIYWIGNYYVIFLIGISACQKRKQCSLSCLATHLLDRLHLICY